MVAPYPEVRMLPVKSLQPCVVNPRFNVGDVSELAESIQALGILVPLLVTPRGKGYLVVAGHRRLAASKQIGLAEVPALIREMGELERMEMMIVENQQRVPLSPVEEGIAYARILKQHPITQRVLASQLGCSQAHISKCLALLRLPKSAVDAVHAGELSMSDALGYNYDGRSERRFYEKGARLSPCQVERHVSHNPDNCQIRGLSERAAG